MSRAAAIIDTSPHRAQPHGAVSSHVQPKRGSQKYRSQHDGTLPGLHASETSGGPGCFTRSRGAASETGRACQKAEQAMTFHQALMSSGRRFLYFR